MTPCPRALRPGSAILIRGAMHVVRTTISCCDAHDVWWEHELDPDAGLWLALEPRPGGTTASLWYRETLDVVLPGADHLWPGPVGLARVEVGSGTYRAAGRTGALGVRAGGDLAYAEYRGNGQHVAYERFGRDGPVMKGYEAEQLSPGNLQIEGGSRG